MRISEVASESGLPAKTIRYYEDTGLIPRARRGRNGYRRYRDSDVHTLRFISRARSLGFSVKDVAALLALWRNKKRASADVRTIALAHIDTIDEKIRSLQAMRSSLRDLVERCHGDERPDCPILDELAEREVT